MQNAVKNLSSKNKCVYCEKFSEGREGDIEHFYPKSLYPLLTFEWSNLFWACKNCNEFQKNQHDTFNLPIIHPENDNPEFFLSYDIKTGSIHATENSIAQRAIDLFKFDSRNGGELLRERFKLLTFFEEFEILFSEKLTEYQTTRSLSLLRILFTKVLLKKVLPKMMILLRVFIVFYFVKALSFKKLQKKSIFIKLN